LLVLIAVWGDGFSRYCNLCSISCCSWRPQREQHVKYLKGLKLDNHPLLVYLRTCQGSAALFALNLQFRLNHLIIDYYYTSNYLL
jgi:hypothetical protein